MEVEENTGRPKADAGGKQQTFFSLYFLKPNKETTFQRTIRDFIWEAVIQQHLF